jgi:hypothetical protein
MAAPNNPNIARFTMVFNRDTRTMVNVFHVYHSTGWTTGNLSTVCEALVVWYNSYYKPCLPTFVSLVNIHAQVYDPAGSPWVFDRPVSPPVAGTRAGEIEPGNVTIAVSLRAAYAGRAYRGRFYIPGLQVGDTNVDDTITSALLALLANAATAFLFTNLPAGYTPVIFHRRNNLFSTIVSYVTENILDSQRRRLPKRGT